MTIEQQITDLTAATTALLDAVVVSKDALDQKVVTATTAANTATEQAASATDSAASAAGSATIATEKAAEAGDQATAAAESATAAATALVATESARDTALAIEAGTVKTINGISMLGDGDIKLTLLPPGSLIVAKAGTVVPGFLQCDGSLFSRTDYPELAKVCQSVGSISGGEQVPNSVIQASTSSCHDWSVRGPERAFDGIIDPWTIHHWHSTSWDWPIWLQAHFSDGPRAVNAYRIYGRGDGFNIERWNLFASNDGSNWTLVDDRTTEPAIPNGGFKDFEVAHPGNYSYYRIQTENRYYTVILELQFFVGASVELQGKLPVSNEIVWLGSGYSFFIKY
jgi:F5/8 type C domain/Phage Tail Collar Domain